MSRDKRLNRTQEVVGSSQISSTTWNFSQSLSERRSDSLLDHLKNREHLTVRQWSDWRS
jgi:hypothetical protein